MFTRATRLRQWQLRRGPKAAFFLAALLAALEPRSTNGFQRIPNRLIASSRAKDQRGDNCRSPGAWSVTLPTKCGQDHIGSYMGQILSAGGLERLKSPAVKISRKAAPGGRVSMAATAFWPRLARVLSRSAGTCTTSWVVVASTFPVKAWQVGLFPHRKDLNRANQPFSPCYIFHFFIFHFFMLGTM